MKIFLFFLISIIITNCSIVQKTPETNTEIVSDYYTAINGYYTLDNGISISAGYEQGTLGGVNALADETSAYMIGVTTEAGPGTFGVALGTNGSQAESAGTITESMMYEAF